MPSNFWKGYTFLQKTINIEKHPGKILKHWIFFKILKISNFKENIIKNDTF